MDQAEALAESVVVQFLLLLGFADGLLLWSLWGGERKECGVVTV